MVVQKLVRHVSRTSREGQRIGAANASLGNTHFRYVTSTLSAKRGKSGRMGGIGEVGAIFGCSLEKWGIMG